MHSFYEFFAGGGMALRSRKPTARECARLMGLPDSYKLPCSTQDAYQLTGNGVVSPVVGWLGEHLLAPLLDAAPYQAASPVTAAERHKPWPLRRLRGRQNSG